jgi:predicted O-linked N-acetylglucosamine transferase (SPINDLY family)
VSIDTLLDQARAALHASDFLKAADLFRKCTVLQPDRPEAWFLLGASLDRCDKPADALQAFAEAERLDPDYPQAANAHAAMLSALGRWEEALAAFERALVRAPGNSQILTNCGIALEKLGCHDQALRSYDTALAVDPEHLGALNNRGILHLKCGAPAAALEDHRRFVAHAPASPIGHYNCAETYAAMLMDQESLAACDATLRLDPHHVKALIVRGLMLSSLGRSDEAGDVLKTAKGLNADLFAETFRNAGFDPADASLMSPQFLYCLRGKERLRNCDWSNYEEFLTRFADTAEALQGGKDEPDYTALAYLALFLPISPSVHFKLARQIATKVQSRCGSIVRREREKDRRIRIGYVSPDFRTHPVAHVMSGLYGLHDRSAFEIYAYSLHPGDGGPLRQQIVAGCDVFRECTEWPTQKIVECIRDDGIDILVDLAGYTDSARPDIFAWRPAAINVSLIGYPGTSGASYMDYRITDSIASPPGEEQYYTEKLVYLNGSCLPYNEKTVIEDAGSRKDHGLPQDAFVFCCFNNPYKIEPTIFSVWMNVLQKVAHSVLWIFAPTPAVKAHLIAEAERRGVDPARLICAPGLPLELNIGRYRLADLFLDTHFYNGHATTLDPLWAGLPVLTWAGSTFAGRIGASHLAHLGMPELIAESASEYERMACDFATQPGVMREVRKKLGALRTGSPLFRSETMARNLDQAYLEMWRRYEAGQESASFTLK